MKLMLFLLTFSLFPFQGFCQLDPVDVADLTIKVGAAQTEELFYGFAEGDEIIFSFEEINGKPLKEIEIIELPTNSKFSDFKSTSIVDKKLTVNKKSIYKFSFKNGSVGGRICKIRIQRIPKTEELIAFNTNWEWKTLYDTTFVPYTEDSIVGYDTVRTSVLVKQLKSDIVELVNVLENHGVEVHSKEYNWTISYEHYGKYNEEIVQINLPETYNTKYKKVENLEWYYGVAVNQKMKLKADQTTADILSLGGNVATFFGLPGAKIGFELLGILTSDKSDHSVYCAVIPNREQALSFKNDQVYTIYREDNIVNSGSIRMDKPLKGTVYLGLSNSSERTGVTVYTSVYVWRRTREYKDVEEIQETIKPRNTTLNKVRLDVKSTKVMVNAG